MTGRGISLHALTIAIVIAFGFAPARAAAQDQGPGKGQDAPKVEEDPATVKGRALKKAVKDGEKGLMEAFDKLQQDAGLKKEAKDPKAGKPDDKAGKPDDKAGKPDDKAGKPDDKAPDIAKEDWNTCGDKNCPKCSKKEFCLKRVERVRDTCQKLMGGEDDIKKRFVQLRINYKKLTEFLNAQAKLLRDQAESPPESENLPGSEKERLKTDYGDMAKQVAGLVPVYDARFQSLEKTEGQVFGKLALLKSKTSLINDMIEAVKGSENIDDMNKEIKELEKSLMEMTGAVDSTLEAFATLAKTIKVEK